MMELIMQEIQYKIMDMKQKREDKQNQLYMKYLDLIIMEDKFSLHFLQIKKDNIKLIYLGNQILIFT